MSKPKAAKDKKNGRMPRMRQVPTTLQVVPPVTNRVYLPFVGYGTFTEGAAKAGNYAQYRLNSIYDPDFTGVGATAIGYTMLSAGYALFRVLRCRVILRIHQTTTGASTVGLLPGLNSTYTSVISLWEAEPNSRSKIIQGNVGGARSIGEFDVTYDLAKIAGVTAEQYRTDFDFTHGSGSNPDRNLYVAVFGVGNSTSVQTYNFSIRLIYEVEASQPLQSLTA